MEGGGVKRPAIMEKKYDFYDCLRLKTKNKKRKVKIQNIRNWNLKIEGKIIFKRFKRYSTCETLRRGDRRARRSWTWTGKP